MRLLTSLTLLATLALPLAAARAETAPAVIRFAETAGGVSKPTGTGLATLAQKLGYFDKEFGKTGPKIQINYFIGTGPAINEALAQDQTDFGSYGGLPNVIGLAGGIPAKAVLMHQAGGVTGVVAVRPDLPLKSFADLRGKRVAVLKGTNPYMTLVLSLESAGVKENQVTIVNLQHTDAHTAFLSGHLDAIYGQVILYALRDQGKAKVLASPDIPSLNAVNTSADLVTDKFARQYPQTTERVVKVLIQAAYWASQPENREAYINFAATTGTPIKYIRESYKSDLKPRFNPAISPDVIAGFKRIASFAYDHKLIRRPDVPNSWFAPQFQQAAIKELKLENFWTQPARP